jgi:hypothetical protein
MHYESNRKETSDAVRKCAKSLPLHPHFIKAVDGKELMKPENINICLKELLVNVKKLLKV